MKMIYYATEHRDLIDKVFIDGRDITNECFAANPKLGLAKVYDRDERGSFYAASDGRAARRLLKGDVVCLPASGKFHAAIG